MSDPVYNFGAGPAMLPFPVMQQIREEFLNFNNMGVSVVYVRDLVLARGIVINGLPIMLRRQSGYGMWGMAFEHLDVYYEDCVIGGPGSFVISIREREQFKEATRTKLVMEVAGVTPSPRVVPAQSRKPRVFCS